MLIVSIEAPEPFWLDASALEPPLRSIPGFKILVKPVEPAMRLTARTAANFARRKAMEKTGIVLPDDPKEAGEILAEHPEIIAAGEEAFTTSLALSGILDWEGVAGPDRKAAKPSPELIRAVLRKGAVYDFIDQKYVLPSMVQDDEKNASSPSRSTTSKRAKRTAKGAARRAGEPAPSALTS